MWGLRGVSLSRSSARAMFPTHVGIARIRLFASAIFRDVPYACGDCAQAMLDAFQAMLCSLRMWGLREDSMTPEATYAMFPTHVGIARMMPRINTQMIYVPYACGDCAGWALPASACAPMFPTHVGIAR